MKVGGLVIDVEAAVKQVKKRKGKRAILQVPEGLKRRAPEMAREFEKAGIEVTLVGDPCYGACDLCTGYDKDIVVHVGHTPIGLSADAEAIFVEAMSTAPVKAVVEKALPFLGKSIGLVSTAQHTNGLDEAKKIIEKSRKKAFIGNGDSRVKHPGQILGCNVSAARAISKKVDSFLFIGTGTFHPIEVSLAFGKPVIAADPVSGEVTDVAPLAERILRRRHGLITIASAAKSFGVIVCTKPGQKRDAVARRIVKMLRKAGREAWIIRVNEIEPWRFKGFGFEALS